MIENFEEGINGTAPVTKVAPLLTILAGLPPASYVLRAGETVVGRSTEADVQFRHPEVSRRHCCLRWDGESGCTVEDLGSHWGTKINGAALPGEGPTPLLRGDYLQVGPIVAYYDFQPPPAEVMAAHAAAGAAGPANLRVIVGGQETETVILGEKRVRFGRGNDVEVVLNDPGVSRQHAAVERVPGGYEVVDLQSRAGTLLNGRRFERQGLVIGDLLQIGPFFFRFDGRALERTTVYPGVEIDAWHLRKEAGGAPIIDNVSLHIERGQFVMILGPSGAGKSSLLDTLTGLRPASRGKVEYDGVDFYGGYDEWRSLLGYVPQDDIVHRELSVARALAFSARLRLPAGTPGAEIEKLVARTASRLGLETRLDTPIHQLSGGERKRVSVGVELLGRPAVLFLDEPTSGLDPASEFKIMELLRHLADGGCTVVCTTHIVENAYLADRLLVLARGRLVFDGTAQEARDHFGVQKLTSLYDRLEERPATAWLADFDVRSQGNEAAQRDPAPNADSSLSTIRARQRPKPRRPAALPVLLARQWAILCADWKNFGLLLGQPLLIAGLVAWATDDVSLSLFFAYLATLWFGCSNAAQEIVRELPIYRREHMMGLGRHAYLLSKFGLWGAVTVGQGMFLYGCLWAARWCLYPDVNPGVPRGIDGAVGWQLGGIVGTAFAAVGIGFALSALARSTMQAVMAVPLVLIPQILFSGMVVETNQMSMPGVYALTSVMPSHAAQTLMDVSAFLNRRITGDLYNAHKKAGDHLRDLFLRGLAAHPPRPGMSRGDLRAVAAEAFRNNQVYRQTGVGGLAACILLGWTLAGYVTATCALRARERG